MARKIACIAVGDFSWGEQFFYAVVLDPVDDSIVFSRECSSVDILRSAVWFNIGPCEWISSGAMSILTGGRILP